MREDTSSLEERRKSRVGQLSLSSVTEDQYPVRVETKTGRKRHGESNGQEKRKKIRPVRGYRVQFQKLTISVKCVKLTITCA